MYTVNTKTLHVCQLHSFFIKKVQKITFFQKKLPTFWRKKLWHVTFRMVSLKVPHKNIVILELLFLREMYIVGNLRLVKLAEHLIFKY